MKRNTEKTLIGLSCQYVQKDFFKKKIGNIWRTVWLQR